jgi:hypothetical protein
MFTEAVDNFVDNLGVVRREASFSTAAERIASLVGTKNSYILATYD